jgi:hypothetical protein
MINERTMPHPRSTGAALSRQVIDHRGAIDEPDRRAARSTRSLGGNENLL